MAKTSSQRHILESATVRNVGSPLAGVTATHLSDVEALGKLAQQIMDDPIALNRLGEKVIKLLAQDIRLQNERGRTQRRY